MSKTRDDFRGARMRSRLFKSGVATPYKQFSRLPHPNPWICASCKFRAVRSRTYSTEQSTSEKPYYITTPIFYVNAGTIASYIYSKKPMELTKASKQPLMLATYTQWSSRTSSSDGRSSKARRQYFVPEPMSMA